jgi:glutamate-1-semialdehyde 2,1-aminomutase
MFFLKSCCHLQEESSVAHLEAKTKYLHEGISKVLIDANVVHTINRVGSMISVHFAPDEVLDFESSAHGNNDSFKAFFHGLLNEGIYIAPSAFETWFITDALSYQDLDDTISAIENVATKL